MKTGRNLQEMLTELQRQEKAKRDFISPSNALRLEDDGRTFDMENRSTGERHRFETTPLFHRQIASTLNIPAKYYDLMQEKKPELLAENVNAWFGSMDKKYMVRSLDYSTPSIGSTVAPTSPDSRVEDSVDGSVGSRIARALLSEQYRRLDNMQVAAAVLPLFAGSDQFDMVSTEVTGTRMFIKVVNKRLEAEVVPGDYVQAGVVISNSEVGLGAVSVQPLLYRLVCTNGMIVNDLGQRKHHIGRVARALEDSFELYSDETIEAENKAFLMKLQDVTRAAIEETKFMQVVDKLRESLDAKITGPVQDVVELTGKNFGISQDEQDGVLKYLIEGGDLSLYGLSNAFTRYSQDVDSYDRATQFEAMGWQIATMPKSDWEVING